MPEDFGRVYGGMRAIFSLTPESGRAWHYKLRHMEKLVINYVLPQTNTSQAQPRYFS